MLLANSAKKISERSPNFPRVPTKLRGSFFGRVFLVIPPPTHSSFFFLFLPVTLLRAFTSSLFFLNERSPFLILEERAPYRPATTYSRTAAGLPRRHFPKRSVRESEKTLRLRMPALSTIRPELPCFLFPKKPKPNCGNAGQKKPCFRSRILGKPPRQSSSLPPAKNL